MKGWTTTTRGAITSLAAINTVGAIAGVLQMAVIAYHFGTSVQYEIYIAATTLLVTTTALMQSGQMSDVFLPMYRRIRQTSIPEARAAFSVVLNWMMLGAGTLAALMWLLAPVVMDLIVPGFDAVEVARGVTVFRAVALIIPIDVGIALTMMLANAERWYGRPEIAATAASLTTVATIAVLGASRQEWSLVYALWAGKIVHVAGIVAIVSSLGYRHAARLRSPQISIRSFASPMATTFVYVAMTQVWAGAFTAGLSMLPQGTLAVFRYVNLLAAKLRTVFMRPVSIVFFTDVSSILAGEPGDVTSLSRLAVGRAFAIWTLMMAAVIAGGHVGLTAILGWERFPPHQIQLAYYLLIVYTALTGFNAFDQIWRRTVIAVGRIRELNLAAAGAQVACAILAMPLVKAFGLAGLVGASTLNVALLTAAPYCLLNGPLRALRGHLPWNSMWRWTMAGSIAAAIALAVHAATASDLSTRGAHVLAAIGLAGGAAALALGIALTLGVPETRELPGSA